jgi:glycosyltransferase involved in cell wall biosynthesis
MKLLYLNYGPQSGVVASLTAELRGRGLDVVPVNAAAGFLPSRGLPVGRRHLPLPNLRWDVMRALVHAAQQHGGGFRAYYLHTCYAFDRLTELADRAIAEHQPHLVLQAGVLHAPGRYPERPYCLYIDNTTALAHRYLAVVGLPPPLRRAAAWHARERSVYRNAAAVFVMSRYVAASLERDYGVDPRRVHWVGAGPNIEPEADPPVEEREPAFLFVGADFADKGGDDLLSAFTIVRAKEPRARLWLVGHRPRRRLDLPGARYFGYLPRPEIARLLTRAHAFVLPSLREPFGLALLEAMAFALPCIATRLAAIPEIVAHGETGLLVPPRDPAALARAMLELLADSARAHAFGRAGRARVSAEYGWRRTAERMLPVMRSPDP